MATTGRVTPNKRQYNPLSQYPSTTYQISLYMLTPDSYDEFINSGKTSITLATPATSGKGAYLIAQSGGFNETEKNSRAEGFNLDYYIDNLSLTQYISPTTTNTNVASTNMQFTITEPYGFSFVTKLKQTANKILSYSTTPGLSNLGNASKQLYVISVKFLGYDSSGRVINSVENVFQRFWDVYFTSIKYKLDGKAVQYTITAAPINEIETYGNIKGRIDLVTTVKGSTVRDLLSGDAISAGIVGLAPKLTADQAKAPGVLRPNRYFIEFIGDDAEAIAGAKVRTKSNKDISTSSGPSISTTNQSNEKQAATTNPKMNTVEMTFAKGCHIIQAIQQVILQSGYVENALTKVFTTDLEPKANTNTRDRIIKQTDTKLKWFNISSKVTGASFDENTNTFSYDMTYYVQSYDIPAIIAPYADSVSDYYGPVKKYDYWFSGKNSEVLKYEQVLDNSYYIVVLEPNGKDGYSNSANVPQVANKVQDAPVTGGKPGSSTLAAQNQIATQITDPANYAKATIEILGDPDLLMHTGFNGTAESYDIYYGPDGFSINPNSGQVFIELDFKEAIDYDGKTGVMSINDKILFWNYPPNVTTSGISYRVNTVKSNFKGGRFTQTLECNINIFGTKTQSAPLPGADRAQTTTGSNQDTSANENVIQDASNLLQSPDVSPNLISVPPNTSEEYST